MQHLPVLAAHGDAVAGALERLLHRRCAEEGDGVAAFRGRLVVLQRVRPVHEHQVALAVGGYYRAAVENTEVIDNDPAGYTTTVAGSCGGYGSTDGDGTAAEFYGPTDVKFLDSDRAVVADRQNHRIRLVDIANNCRVTTLAGWSSGSNDGTGTSARFTRPMGICVNADGSVVYVMDEGNNKIRQIIVCTGVVTTLTFSEIGDWIKACVVAPPEEDIIILTQGNIKIEYTRCRFSSGLMVKEYYHSQNNIGQLALSNDGDEIWFASSNQGRIFKYLRSGDGSRIFVAGTSNGATADGPADQAGFYYGWGIAFSKDGHTVYVNGYNSIRSIDVASGTVTTLAGPVGTTSMAGCTDGDGLSARFYHERGMDISPDGLYLLTVSDQKHAIRRISLGPYTNTYTTYTGACTSCGENRTSLAENAGLGPAACEWNCAAGMYVHTEVPGNTSTQLCQACPPGSTSAGGNVTTCSCVEGYYQPARYTKKTGEPLHVSYTSYACKTTTTAGSSRPGYEGQPCNFPFYYSSTGEWVNECVSVGSSSHPNGWCSVDVTGAYHLDTSDGYHAHWGHCNAEDGTCLANPQAHKYPAYEYPDDAAYPCTVTTPKHPTSGVDIDVPGYEGQPCEFPFEYGGEWVSECQDIGTADFPNGWCGLCDTLWRVDNWYGTRTLPTTKVHVLHMHQSYARQPGNLWQK